MDGYKYSVLYVLVLVRVQLITCTGEYSVLKYLVLYRVLTQHNSELSAGPADVAAGWAAHTDRRQSNK